MAKDNEKVLTQEEALALKEELELARKQAEAQKAEAEKMAEALEAAKAEAEAAKSEAEAAKEALEQANKSGEAETPEQLEEERVPYILPRNILSDAKHHTVNLNGVNYQVQVGVQVMVPKGVAEILNNALEQRMAANELQEELTVEQ